MSGKLNSRLLANWPSWRVMRSLNATLRLADGVVLVCAECTLIARISARNSPHDTEGLSEYPTLNHRVSSMAPHPVVGIMFKTKFAPSYPRLKRMSYVKMRCYYDYSKEKPTSRSFINGMQKLDGKRCQFLVLKSTLLRYLPI